MFFLVFSLSLADAGFFAANFPDDVLDLFFILIFI
jgi:hypothetical protein